MTFEMVIKENMNNSISHKFNILNVMDKFLEGNILPKLTKGKIGKLNRSMSIKDSEAIINILPIKKAQFQMVSFVYSTKYLRNTL